MILYKEVVLNERQTFFAQPFGGKQFVREDYNFFLYRYRYPVPIYKVVQLSKFLIFLQNCDLESNGFSKGS